MRRDRAIPGLVALGLCSIPFQIVPGPGVLVSWGLALTGMLLLLCAPAW